jgi:hypothetical protein
MVECGVPIARAEAAIQRRMQQVELNSHARNYLRVVQAAQLLKLAFLNIHVPCDLITRRLIAEKMARFNDPKSRATVAEVIAALQEFPEHRAAATEPQVRLGAPDRLAGRVTVAMGGYTNGGVDVLRAYRRGSDGSDDALPRPTSARREAATVGHLSVTQFAGSGSASASAWTNYSRSASRSWAGGASGTLTRPAHALSTRTENACTQPSVHQERRWRSWRS